MAPGRGLAGPGLGSRALYGLLALTYGLIVWKDFQGSGAHALRYFCTYNWLGLAALHLALAVDPRLLRRPALVVPVHMLYGGSLTMAISVWRYWPDRTDNGEHILAHYFPAAHCAALTRLASPVPGFWRKVVLSVWWQLVFFFLIPDPQKVYGLVFEDKWFNLALCLTIPAALRVLWE